MKQIIIVFLTYLLVLFFLNGVRMILCSDTGSHIGNQFFQHQEYQNTRII